MKLRQPTREEVQQVRIWRNDPAVLPMLRTKEPLTEAQQDAFYDCVICGPSPHLYYALDHNGRFVGLGGLTHLKVDGDKVEGEISLILGPEFRGRGLGSMAVDALLAEAKAFGITSVVGECYSTGNLGFWYSQLRRRLPRFQRWSHNGSFYWMWEL